MAAKSISQLPAPGALSGSEAIEVAVLSDTVTITAATISADGDDNSFNDSADGFVSAGFAVGDRVNVAGFTGDGGNNLYSGVITALTTAKMTIGGTDGDVIVDDAAGESVTIAKWVSARTTAQAIVDLAGGGSGGPAATIIETGTAVDLDPADAGKYQRWTDDGTKTLTVRDEADVPLPADGEWHIRNVGAGDLTLAEDTAVTINPPNGGTLVVPQGGTVTLKRVAEDEFDLLGQTVSA